ncbi:anti-sigma factor family protein [Hyphomonas sp.]|uniref:anti-sigma factor family protein n=1 Tax=Hyphomonas sp. TaxID=87 RepID=UPI00391BC7C5
MTDKVTDEMIMALADGQLPRLESDRVWAAVEASSELRARFEAYKESQLVLSEAFGGILERPVPAAMQQLVLGKLEERGDVVSLDRVRANRRLPLRLGFVSQAAAAAVLLSAAALSGYQVGQNTPADGAIVLAGLVPQDSPLQTALTTTLAGATIDIDEAQFLAVATYQTEGGQVCREFELNRTGSGTVGLACRTDAGWQIEVAALNMTAGTSDQFLPASADAFELVGAVLDAKGTYDGVDAALEACVLKQHDCAEAR